MNAGHEAGQRPGRKLVVPAVILALVVGVAAYIGPADAPTTAKRSPAATKLPGSDGVPIPSSSAAPAANKVPAKTIPWVRTRAELAAVLAAHGLRPDPPIDALRRWRIARGFVGPDPLVDDRDTHSAMQDYEALDPATLRGLADGGDMVALQIMAARAGDTDAMTALTLFARAAEHGSTWSMFQVGRILNDFSQLTPAERQANARVDKQLLDMQGGKRDQDVRELALAWGLAAIRQDGPAATDTDDMEWLEAAAGALRPDRLAAACDHSLAVFAEITAARRSADDPSLPPVFLAPAELYDRLPCADAVAPVSPPPEIARCRKQPVSGDGGRAMDLWICPQN